MLAGFEFIGRKSFRGRKEELSGHFTDLTEKFANFSQFIDLSFRWTDSVVSHSRLRLKRQITQRTRWLTVI